MRLACVALAPSGFDIRTFECARCSHAHLVPIAIGINRSRVQAAGVPHQIALEEAQTVSPGAHEPRVLKRRAYSVEPSTIRR